VLADWFDGEWWKHHGVGEYRDPVSPLDLLAAAPEVIWPGLMGCDLLPLIGNASGDWLCGQVDQNNQLSRVVQWYHGGGDWIPWGNELSEAILFDTAVGSTSQPLRRHSLPAEPVRVERDRADYNDDPLLQWALSHLPGDGAKFLQKRLQGEELSDAMLEMKLAEIAVRCERVISLLAHWPRAVLLAEIDENDPVDRARVTQWSFDSALIPPSIRTKLGQRIGTIPNQDWQGAAAEARIVSQLAPELAWPWEIVGYEAERRGDLEQAFAAYRHAANCSVFTDQSVRLDTHWLSSDSAKFSVARLRLHRPDEINRSPYYELLCRPDAGRRRRSVTEYWTRCGMEHAGRQNFHRAHECFVAAAWDVGAEPMSAYARCLELIAEAARASGQTGRAELARTHRLCLRDRYNV
jgi:hypothetical protein